MTLFAFKSKYLEYVLNLIPDEFLYHDADTSAMWMKPNEVKYLTEQGIRVWRLK